MECVGFVIIDYKESHKVIGWCKFYQKWWKFFWGFNWSTTFSNNYFFRKAMIMRTAKQQSMLTWKFTKRSFVNIYWCFGFVGGLFWLHKYLLKIVHVVYIIIQVYLITVLQLEIYFCHSGEVIRSNCFPSIFERKYIEFLETMLL